MLKYSSKSLNFNIAEAYVNVEIENNGNTNGLLLLTSFGIVYGEVQSTNETEPKTIADILVDLKQKELERLDNNNYEFISDGSVIVLKNAVVKYSSGITLNMKEIIIFCDQVIGYYPIDLSTFGNQIPKV